jgi:MFS family permease
VLRSRPFSYVVGMMLLGWTLEGVVLPVVPLLVIERGGDAVVVGLVAAAYALPSIALRPTIGRIIDARGHELALRLGALGFVIAPIGYLLPPLGLILVARLIQGLAWTMYSTATHVVVARLAPVDRRGEASGYSSFARAAGLFVGPPAGIALFLQAGEAVFLLASALGAVCLLAAWFLNLHGPDSPPAQHEHASPDAGPWYRRLLEPAAVPSMVVVATFVSSQTIFVGFAPVFARSVGASATELAVFYSTFALVLAISPLINSRISDRIGRRAAIISGCAVATVGLLVAALPGGMVTFTIGALCVAFANSIVTTAVAAATMDVAPPGRMGSSLATYAVGFQLASGIGGAVWGVAIVVAGFPWPFLFAITFQVVSVIVAFRWMARPASGTANAPRSATGG